jgi:hypothetical protein
MGITMKNIFIIILFASAILLGQTADKKFFTEKKVNGGAEKIGQYNFISYSVKSDAGKELYQIVDKVDYDVPLAKLEVFENGNSVLISSFSGMLTFIGNSGSKISTKKIIEKMPVEYERNMISVVDNEKLILLLNDPTSEYSLIYKYNSSGIRESEFSINKTNVNGIAFSEKLGQVYLSYVEWDNSGKPTELISIIDNNGKELATLDGNFEKGFYTESNQFVGYSNKSIICLDTEKMQLNFKNKVQENHINIDVTFNSGNLIVASAPNPELKDGKWLFKNPTITQLDTAGKVIEAKKIESKVFSEFGFKRMDGNKEFYMND